MLFVKIFISLLTLALLLTNLAFAEPVTIKFSHMDGQETPKGKASEYFKRLVEQRSGNRILVEIYSRGSLLDDRNILEALKSNAIQMAAPNLTSLYDASPQLQLFDLPFLFNDVEHLHTVIDGEVGSRMLVYSSQNGLIALSFWDNGFKQLTANRQLIVPQDAAGLRFRVTGSDVPMEQFRSLAAIPQSMPLSQLYDALKSGNTDGQESSLDDIYNQGLYHVQSDLTISNHGYLGYLVLTNSDFWTQLPKDLKVIIQGAIKDAAEYTREMAIQLNNEALKKIRSTDKINIHQLTFAEREAWRNKLVEIYPGFYNKIDKKLVQRVRKEQIR